MTEEQIETAFQELIKDSKKMKEIGIARDYLYKLRNPSRHKMSLGKKLEILFKCGKLHLK